MCEGPGPDVEGVAKVRKCFPLLAKVITNPFVAGFGEISNVSCRREVDPGKTSIVGLMGKGSTGSSLTAVAAKDDLRRC